MCSFYGPELTTYLMRGIVIDLLGGVRAKLAGDPSKLLLDYLNVQYYHYKKKQFSLVQEPT